MEIDERLLHQLPAVQVVMYAYLSKHPGACYEEISGDMGISTRAVCYHLRALEEKGFIRRKGRKKRAEG